MNKESLAKAILQAMKDQSRLGHISGRYLHIFGDDDINDVSLYGPVDLIQLAESLLGFMAPRNTLSVNSIEASASSPVIRILWGDNVVTYAHFTQEAEIVHSLAREGITERIGKPTPEEAMAS